MNRCATLAIRDLSKGYVRAKSVLCDIVLDVSDRGMGGTLFAAYQRFDYDFVYAILLGIIGMIVLLEVLASWNINLRESAAPSTRRTMNDLTLKIAFNLLCLY